MSTKRRMMEMLELLSEDAGVTEIVGALAAAAGLKPETLRRARRLRKAHRVQHDISTQDECIEVTARPSSDHRWYQGLSRSVDQEILGGRIVAYQIRWFNGDWSDWIVPGINDIDSKHNHASYPGNKAVENTMRLMWSYFHDHEHRYILHRSKEVAPRLAETPLISLRPN